MGSNHDYAVLAYDADSGRELWLARFDGAASKSDRARSMVVSPDGATLFVTGGSVGSASGNDYATVAYDAAAGHELWVARYNGPGNSDDIANSAVVSPDGTTLYVTGGSTGPMTGYDYATVAYRAADGQKEWVARYNGPGNREDVANAASLSPDGTVVYVTGRSAGGGTGADYATLAYDSASGEQAWLARTSSPLGEWDNAQALSISRDGTKVFVAGVRHQGFNCFFVYTIVAYDAASGQKLWDASRSCLTSPSLYPASVVTGPAGTTVFMTAESMTVAYEAATGRKLWIALHRYGELFSQAASPDGTKLFVTGESSRPGSTADHDFITIAYDAASGAKLWVARYRGPGNFDFALRVAVSPDGATVFVTGMVSRPSSRFQYDIATVAYEA